VELRRARAKRIARDTRGILYCDLQYAVRIGRPDTAVLKAERTAARVRWNVGRIGLPREAERYIAAVALAGDQHYCDFHCWADQLS